MAAEPFARRSGMRSGHGSGGSGAFLFGLAPSDLTRALPEFYPVFVACLPAVSFIYAPGLARVWRGRAVPVSHLRKIVKNFFYARFWFWGCVWGCLFGLLPAHAYAQAQEAGEAPGLQELRDDMRRLESQLEALRLEQSSQSSQQNAPGAAPLPGTAPPSRALFLSYQQRLADFEQAFAQLTAQLESLEQRLSLLERALERLTGLPPSASAAVPPSPSPPPPLESAPDLSSPEPSELPATSLLPELSSEAGGVSSGSPEAPPASGIPREPGESVATPESLYAQAFASLQRRELDQAFEAFGRYLELYPQGSHLVLVHYWLGEIYAVRQNHAEAAASYLKAAEVDENSETRTREGARAFLRLAFSLEALDKAAEACEVLRHLLGQYEDVLDPDLLRSINRSLENYSCP